MAMMLLFTLPTNWSQRQWLELPKHITDELLAGIHGSDTICYCCHWAQGIITPSAPILCTKIGWYFAIRGRLEISEINFPLLLARLWPFTIIKVVAFHSPSFSLTEGSDCFCYTHPNRPEQDALPKWCPECCGTHWAMAHGVVHLIAMTHTVDSRKINHLAHARKNQTWPASWEAYSPSTGPDKDLEMNILSLHSQC